MSVVASSAEFLFQTEVACVQSEDIFTTKSLIKVDPDLASKNTLGVQLTGGKEFSKRDSRRSRVSLSLKSSNCEKPSSIACSAYGTIDGLNFVRYPHVCSIGAVTKWYIKDPTTFHDSVIQATAQQNDYEYSAAFVAFSLVESACLATTTALLALLYFETTAVLLLGIQTKEA